MDRRQAGAGDGVDNVSPLSSSRRRPGPITPVDVFCEEAFDHPAQLNSRWLWVPACAGTTLRELRDRTNKNARVAAGIFTQTEILNYLIVTGAGSGGTTAGP